MCFPASAARMTHLAQSRRRDGLDVGDAATRLVVPSAPGIFIGAWAGRPR
jgi:hypothetical protein